MPDSVRRDRRAAEALSRPSPAPLPGRPAPGRGTAGKRGFARRVARWPVRTYLCDVSVRYIGLAHEACMPRGSLRAVTGRQEAGAAMSASRSGTLELAVLGLLH